jgi:hypothetical protein
MDFCDTPEIAAQRIEAIGKAKGFPEGEGYTVLRPRPFEPGKSRYTVEAIGRRDWAGESVYWVVAEHWSSAEPFVQTHQVIAEFPGEQGRTLALAFAAMLKPRPLTDKGCPVLGTPFL